MSLLKVTMWLRSPLAGSRSCPSVARLSAEDRLGGGEHHVGRQRLLEGVRHGGHAVLPAEDRRVARLDLLDAARDREDALILDEAGRAAVRADARLLEDAQEVHDRLLIRVGGEVV